MGELTLVRCVECVFWDAHGGMWETGACCRHAPRPRLADELDDDGHEAGVVWPITRREDGCGEGRRRESGEDAKERQRADCPDQPGAS